MVLAYPVNVALIGDNEFTAELIAATFPFIFSNADNNESEAVTVPAELTNPVNVLLITGGRFKIEFISELILLIELLVALKLPLSFSKALNIVSLEDTEPIVFEKPINILKAGFDEDAATLLISNIAAFTCVFKLASCVLNPFNISVSPASAAIALVTSLAIAVSNNESAIDKLPASPK